ncbi:hypothetical protein [Halomonas daqiaonensis]|uniref:Uncharacterized protein n=1 Tax=Halomonas daqiaonensis TaxID=650850 RepID=A0A1H7VM61_9GAMM|nr:hypothetical protein [Halomonas daqiaonensis]SEM10124.1 hypothetical protein SAMN04488129_1264 [Halomonas daqiaonensis]
MQLPHQRQVQVTPKSRLSITTYTASLRLQDLDLGTQQGQRVEHDVDCTSHRPVGFIHRDGDVELLNRALLPDLTDHLDAEQSVLCDLIKISEVNDEEELALRFWYEERAWCQHHRHSRYTPRTPSWQDIVTILIENDDVALAVARCLFGRKTLRLIDLQWLCAERASLATISTFRTQLEYQNAA